MNLLQIVKFVQYLLFYMVGGLLHPNTVDTSMNAIATRRN